VSGLGEKEQRLDVEVLDTLASDAEALSDLGEGLRGQAAEALPEAIVGDDDQTQARRERAEQAVELGLDLPTVELLGNVGQIIRQSERLILVGGQVWPSQPDDRSVLGDRVPDGTLDRDDGIGAEPGPSRGIVALERVPEPDPSRLDGLLEGQAAKTLSADHPMNQALVLGHLLG
jgi:hypothetical protein